MGIASVFSFDGASLLASVISAVVLALVVAFRRMLRTSVQIVRVQMWAWLQKRHTSSPPAVRKIIEDACRADLLEKKNVGTLLEKKASSH